MVGQPQPHRAITGGGIQSGDTVRMGALKAENVKMGLVLQGPVGGRVYVSWDDGSEDWARVSRLEITAKKKAERG